MGEDYLLIVLCRKFHARVPGTDIVSALSSHSFVDHRFDLYNNLLSVGAYQEADFTTLLWDGQLRFLDASMQR